MMNKIRDFNHYLVKNIYFIGIFLLILTILLISAGASGIEIYKRLRLRDCEENCNNSDQCRRPLFCCPTHKKCLLSVPCKKVNYIRDFKPERVFLIISIVFGSITGLLLLYTLCLRFLPFRILDKPRF